jgi:hypothetical protein
MFVSSNYLGLCCSLTAILAKVPHNHRSRIIVYNYINTTYKPTPEMSHTAFYSRNFYWNKPSPACVWRRYILNYAIMTSYKMITKQSTWQSCEASNISRTGSIYTALPNLTTHKAPWSYCCLKRLQKRTKTWLTDFLITANNR